MIAERLRPIFALERRPLLIWYLAFGLTLSPITMIRAALVDTLLFLVLFGLQLEIATLVGALFFSLLLSFVPAVFFLAWSLPGAHRHGVPKRSFGALCLLIAYHPARLYLEGIFTSEDRLAGAESIHEQFPIVWAFKHFDTPLLLVLVVWASLRRQTAKPEEKTLFHWALFLCILWAVCALNDAGVGFMLQVIP